MSTLAMVYIFILAILDLKSPTKKDLRWTGRMKFLPGPASRTGAKSPERPHEHFGHGLYIHPRHFRSEITNEKGFTMDWKNEIFAGTCVTHGGEITRKAP